jgi:hypothetical protein
MGSFFRIHDLSPGLDGLIVEGIKRAGANKIEIDKIINPNAILGDRQVTLPVTPDSLFISDRNLSPCDDPGRREFASDNPFGNFIDKCQYERGTLRVTVSHFERALTVDIKDTSNSPIRTVLCENFFTSVEEVKDSISHFFQNPIQYDPDDLVFMLQELKNTVRKA